MLPDPRRPGRRGAGRTWSLVDLPFTAVPVVLIGGLVAVLVALGFTLRVVTGPVVDALAPVVAGDEMRGFPVGLACGLAALLATRLLWRGLWREVRVAAAPVAARVAGLAAWFAVLLPWAVLMPNLRGGGDLSAGERLVSRVLPGARPGAFVGVVAGVVLWMVLDRRVRRR